MTNMNKLDQKVKALHVCEAEMAKLTTAAENLRSEIRDILSRENLGQYKNDVATVSRVERKRVVILDETQLLKDLQAQRIVRYYEEIPAHVELKKDFTEDVKDGKFSHPGVKVETSENLQVRFADIKK